MKKKLFILLGSFLSLTLLLPAGLVFLLQSTSAFGTTSKSDVREKTTSNLSSNNDKVNTPQMDISSSDTKPHLVRVYMAKQKRVIELPLEDYVKGVVASEMSANFHMEAIKAQAIAARTFIYSKLTKNAKLDTRVWSIKAKNAHVSDTVSHQVYNTDSALKRFWGDMYADKIVRIEQAVNDTAGQIITYEGKPIYAAFFAISNGKTENSEDYFVGAAHPYLRSVTSEWDQRAPKFERKSTFKLKELVNILEKKTGKKIAIPVGTGDISANVSRTKGNRIEKITLGSNEFKGREIRTALGLASSDFKIDVKDDEVTFTTLGWGHGVGMSQWGANFMAQSGKSYTQILTHYYTGVTISKI